MSYLPSEPVIILTATEARILWQAARLNDLRLKHRSGDDRLYALLAKVYQVGLLQIRTTGPGNEPRQNTATEERRAWTVRQLANATGRAERTVRLDIEKKALPATKQGGTYIINSTEAATYIAAHGKN